MTDAAPLAAAIVRSLDAEALDKLADLLAPRLENRMGLDQAQGDGWMDAKAAAGTSG